MAKGRATVKVKKMTMASQSDADSLNTMFEQMTGVQNAEIDVIIPKYVRIYTALKKYVKLFNLLLSFGIFRQQFQEFDGWFAEIERFRDKLIETTKLDIDKVYSEDEYEGIKDDKFNAMYKELKNNRYVKTIVITTATLIKYKKYLDDLNNLDDSFIAREPGLSLEPFAFTHLDLKLMWCSDNITAQSKKYMLNIVSHAYKVGFEIYDTTTSPDVDISKFSDVLVGSIAKMRKQIPRCDKAFDIIEKSVLMLESNFTTYYRSAAEAENPSLIMQDFILDVSQNQKADAQTTMQFKKIVSFMQQKTSQSADPKVKKLFGMLNSQFSAMDRELGVVPVETNNSVVPPDLVEGSDLTGLVEGDSADLVEGDSADLVVSTASPNQKN